MRFASLMLLGLASLSQASGSGFAGLCNTGVINTGGFTSCSSPTGNGTGLAPFGPEQNWVLTGGTAQVPSNFPGPPNWIANGPVSQWISPLLNATNGVPGGTYIYTLTFMVPLLADLSTATISGRYASDNNALSVSLNGQALAGFPLNPNTQAAFRQWTNFTIPTTANFAVGSNTLAWAVNNESGPHGLRIEFFESNVSEAPEPSTILLGGLGLVALGIARRRKAVARSES